MKTPRLFYHEESENCWTPAAGLSIDDIVSLEMLDNDEVISIDFKRVDMTDEEFYNLPEM